MRLRDQLLTVSDAYAKAVGKSEARVSTIVYGSGNAISRLRDGADMGSERLHNGLQWFSDHWPVDSELAWPADVERPPPTESTSAGSSPGPLGSPPVLEGASA